MACRVDHTIGRDHDDVARSRLLQFGRTSAQGLHVVRPALTGPAVTDVCAILARCAEYAEFANFWKLTSAKQIRAKSQCSAKIAKAADVGETHRGCRTSCQGRSRRRRSRAPWSAARQVQLTGTLGSLFYVAPEVLEGSYGLPCDVWSPGARVARCAVL